MHEFKVWAPKARIMKLSVKNRILPMDGPDERGWWTKSIEDAGPGTDYAFLVDEDRTPYPDPRSAYQPGGVHGASRVVDQHDFPWDDVTWQGIALASSVIYELHIGTFTAEGTFDAAIGRLDYLFDLGVTHIELMPVAEFPGDFGWGYDGVTLFSVRHAYGGPDGLKRLVNACHLHGIGVILDVVYNHFGPVGNYANKFGPYLTDHHRTPWGDAINFEDRGSDEVRRFFCDNALMWMRDYHIDGLRLDAVHEFNDRSAIHFMEQLSAEIEVMSTTLGRRFMLIAESDLNDPRVVTPREARGLGMDAQWSDDFHHSLFTILYPEDSGGYYADFSSWADLVKSLTHMFVYDGVYSIYRQRTHGRPVQGLSAHHFIGFIQNHDQVGNRATGDRLEHIVGVDRAKVAAALVMMAPFVPMIFQGEEFAASSPFQYFAHHEEAEMAKAVSEGRRREFAAFGWDPNQIPDPEKPATFGRSKLNWDEIHESQHEEMLNWYTSLIHLRRSTPSLNDGDLNHIKVSCDEKKRWMRMDRGSIRIICNLGEEAVEFDDLGAFSMLLSSRADVHLEEKNLLTPSNSVVILSTASEAQ